MLDLLWRTGFRWKIAPRQVTGDTAYGTTENIAAVERAGIRAYVPLTGAGKARPYFSKEEFVYDPKQDLYQCSAGETLTPKTFRSARNQILYKTEPGTCDSCSMRSECTDNKTGRQVLRHRDERYVDRVKSYPVAPLLTRRHCARGGYGWSHCLVKPRTGTVYADSGSGGYRR
jgi:hypothetical protein